MAEEVKLQEGWGELDEESLRTIARDLYHGLIFCDRHVRNPSDLSMVFMVLLLGGLELHEQLQANPPGLVYEYYDKAGPRSVNGMPCFFSCKILSQKDATRVFEYYEEFKKADESIGVKDPVPDEPGDEVPISKVIERIIGYCMAKEEEIVHEFFPPMHPDSVPYMMEPENWEFIKESVEKEFVVYQLRCKPFDNEVMARVKLSLAKDKIKSIKVGE